MNDLRLHLDDVDFDRLVEIARSLIPTLAPQWTDHNTHDPGIMLLELLAWVADAQIYSLSRLRRDERLAYARLVGIEPRGPQAASGLVWPLPRATAGESATSTGRGDVVVPAGTVVDADQPDAPPFLTTRQLRITNARPVGVVTHFADGSIADWTFVNTRDGATFLPFGSDPSPDDRLVLRFAGSLAADPKGSAAPLAIGVEVVTPRDATVVERAADEPTERGTRRGSRLRVSLGDSDGERPLELVEDTTDGLLHTGLLLLRVGQGAKPSDETFSLTIRSAPEGLLRPPRVQRIALDVLPVEQLRDVLDEVPEFGQDLPDQTYRLREPGLVDTVETLRVVRLLGTGEPWRVVANLDDSGPDARVVALDAATGVLSFGNGVNGARPPLGATLQVEYRVSRGAAGNLPPGVAWTVPGIAGVFGRSDAAITGGVDARGLAELRTLARRSVGTARPLVTRDDLTAAACALTDLGVARATELLARRDGDASDARERWRREVRGTRTLVVVAHPAVDGDGSHPAESPAWLDEVRRRLAPRLPLGQRLLVLPPRYVPVAVKAKLLAARGVDPDVLRQAAEERLRSGLAIVAEPGGKEWPFGRDVTAPTIAGWLRKIVGVARVVEVRLLAGGRASADGRIALGRRGLPRLVIAPGDVVVERRVAEGTR